MMGVSSRIKSSLTTGLLIGLSITLVSCATRSRLKVGKTVEGEVVESEGFTTYEPSDLMKSKRGALADAQRNAVEKAVGVYVSARTFVEKAVAIENNILAKTEGYIKKYDVLSEGPDKDLYKMKIRALVAVKNLESDLRDMSLLKTPELERPRVQVIISEVGNGKPLDDTSAQIAFEKSLLEQGYRIKTKEEKTDADLIVTGQATSSPFSMEQLGGFQSARARLTIQVKRPGTDTVVLSQAKEASGLGVTTELAILKSLETVGALCGQETGTQLASSVGKGRFISVFVENVKSLGDVDRFKKFLTAQPDVRDLVLRRYEENTAEFEVQLGQIQATDLSMRMEKNQSIKLSVLESSGQLIRLKLE